MWERIESAQEDELVDIFIVNTESGKGVRIPDCRLVGGVWLTMPLGAVRPAMIDFEGYVVTHFMTPPYGPIISSSFLLEIATGAVN